MSGWIKIHRRLCADDFWLSEPFTDGQAWVDLLMLANHTDGYIKVRGIRHKVSRGEVGWSELKLSKRWQWSRGKVRRFLSFLQQENMIKIGQQNNKVTTIISICKYVDYQANGTTSDTTDGQQTVQQTDTNKNEEEEKEKILTENFEKFRLAYRGRKRGLSTEFANLKSKHKDWRQVVPILHDVIQKQHAIREHKKKSGEFVPEWKNLQTWINNRCWEEEETTAVETPKHKKSKYQNLEELFPND